MKNKICIIPKKTDTDVAIAKKKFFTGFSSICNDEQLIDLAGVTFNNFQLLLKTLTTNYKYSINSDFFFILKKKLRHSVPYFLPNSGGIAC